MNFMTTTRIRLNERRNPFLLTVAFLAFSLIVIIFFTTDTTKRLSSFYSIRSQPQTHPIIPSTPNPRSSSVSNADDEDPNSEERGEENVINGYDGGGFEKLGSRWEICGRGNESEAVDTIPCLDNLKAIKALKSRRRMEHRERHCPKPSPRCLVPLPLGYKIHVPWPKSRDMVWFENVPHSKLIEYKKDQNWVRKSGEYLVFPGGGTQFKDGVNSYIQFIEQILPAIEWGRHTRVVLDVGCGVASFGGYLLDKDVITMSFAPKDEHEAQVQFALERGIPAVLSVIGTHQLTFSDNAFDLIHCARCRVHWDGDGGKPLIELNRILRPGGFFVWSATPVYRDDPRDQSVWNAMVTLIESICWKVVAKATDSTGIGIVIYQKPTSSSFYKERNIDNPPLCNKKNRSSILWYAALEGCLPPIHTANSDVLRIGSTSWPERLNIWPSNLFEPNSESGEERFYEDMKHWEALVSGIYMQNLSINWPSIRNVMDMNAGFGGFSAALIKEPLWVMNVAPIHGPDTLPVIFDRGLIGIYHDWCESFSTYPRTYDLLHSSFLFSNLLNRCDLIDVVIEVDRILRPSGWILIQDTEEMIKKLNPMLLSLHMNTSIHSGSFLVGRKGFWRPSS